MRSELKALWGVLCTLGLSAPAVAEGLKQPANWKQLAPFQQQFQVANVDLPRTFDWRVQAGGLPKVNLQLASDCWAQGTVGVLESLLKIHFHQDIRMSVQEIISCSGSGSARSGGFFAHAYHQKKGAVGEAVFPYTGRDIRCKAGLQPQQKLAQWGYIGPANRRPTTVEMKQALLEHGPIGVTITANSALQRFRGDGVFRGCSNGSTNHIEVVVGYNDDEGGGVWFVRNSWGTSHGKDGYAKIPYGCSRIGETSTWADLYIPGTGFVPAIETLD